MGLSYSLQGVVSCRSKELFLSECMGRRGTPAACVERDGQADVCSFLRLRQNEPERSAVLLGSGPLGSGPLGSS